MRIIVAVFKLIFVSNENLAIKIRNVLRTSVVVAADQWTASCASDRINYPEEINYRMALCSGLMSTQLLSVVMLRLSRYCLQARCSRPVADNQ